MKLLSRVGFGLCVSGLAIISAAPPCMEFIGLDVVTAALSAGVFLIAAGLAILAVMALLKFLNIDW